jgi:hypothetical protein
MRRTRSAAAFVAALLLTLSTAQADEARHAAKPEPKGDTVFVEGGTPLESIGEEAAETGDGGNLEDADPVSREVGDMIRSEDADGCEGNMSVDCPSGE